MWFGKSFGARKRAHRSSLLGGFTKASRSAQGRALRLEPLEERRLLATFYMSGNWAFLTDNDSSSSLTAGDTVTNTNDTAGPTVTATYGGDAYGVVTSGDYTGSLAGFETIQDAIDDAVALDVVAVLQGTYDENLSISTDNITLQGNTGTATDVVVADVDDSGDGIAVTSHDVTIRDLHVTGAGDDGIAVDGVN
ncbi:MAG: hypothetical protein HQ582_14165, partial [Planctomycetes bacterium]|nr:hypothetical protein [Planctomycetota bacterium]